VTAQAAWVVDGDEVEPLSDGGPPPVADVVLAVLDDVEAALDDVEVELDVLEVADELLRGRVVEVLDGPEVLVLGAASLAAELLQAVATAPRPSPARYRSAARRSIGRAFMLGSSSPMKAPIHVAERNGADATPAAAGRQFPKGPIRATSCS
jgi:hypothetical protein